LIAASTEAVMADPVAKSLLEEFPSPVFILNHDRQIVAANAMAIERFSKNPGDLLGRRPGEALCCIRQAEGPDGCGTSRFCKHCGTFNVVQRSQAARYRCSGECRLWALDKEGREQAFDFRITAAPLRVDRPYTLMIIQDISAEKRRDALERMFYHDLMNSVGALCGLLELWDEATPAAEIRTALSRVADETLEQVRSARDLGAAERGELDVVLGQVDPVALVARLCDTYQRLPMCKDRTIRYTARGKANVVTDGRLLYRSMENLMKNAVEATPAGGTVTVSWNADSAARFAVHNGGVIPQAVQDQLFQRSFSTKSSSGHGIGLYSVKLLVERYLNGWVGFESTERKGTTFWIELG
jgi:signal transduction histidine kinase